MKHEHPALSDPLILDHAAWKCDNEDRSSLLELIRRLSQKPYAPEVAAFWQMQCFNIAGPMTRDGQKFVGEARAFITVSRTTDNLISVSFHDENESLEPHKGDIAAAESLVDALVVRILKQKVEQAGASDGIQP